MTPAANATVGDVKLAVTDAAGVVGNTIDVRVKIENASQVYGASFNIVYDKSYLEVEDCVKGDAFGNITPTINTNHDDGKNIRVAWFAATGLGDGDLINITFKTLKTGNSQVAIENVKLSNINISELACSTTAGNVGISGGASAVLNEISVISADNACLKKCGTAYEYSIENMECENKVLYTASYDSDGKLKNSTVLKKERTFSGNAAGMKFFAWDSKMLPLRKAVSIDSTGVVYGLIASKGNTFEASVTNSSAQSETVTLCAVQYNSSGLKIKSAEEQNIVAAGTTDTFGMEFDVKNTEGYIEVFVLNQSGVTMGAVLKLEM